MRRIVSRQAAEERPWLVWNAFVDLLAMSDLDELEGIQQVCWLSFWYDAEVCNGGHLQCFVNQKTPHHAMLEQALRTIKAECQVQVLQTAVRLLEESGIPQISTVDDFAEQSLRAIFRQSDFEYHKCRPTVGELLRRQLDANLQAFIEWVD